MNIKFNYRYRDAGNYKTYGFVIFCNPDNLELHNIEDAIRKNLIDEEFFDPKTLKVPPLRHSGFKYDAESDHSWNEFDSVEETLDHVTDNRSINELM